MKTQKRSLEDFKSVIEHSFSFTITTHRSPDSDAWGSVQTVTKLLSTIDKKVVCCLDDKMSIDPKSDCVIFLDSPTPERTPISSSSFIKSPITINIDHHQQDRPFADINIVDTDSSSTAEILFDIILDVFTAKPDKDIAEWLLQGIIGDTRSFQHATTIKTLEVAAQLMNLGGNITRASQKNFGGLSIATLRTFGKALSRINLSKTTAFSALTSDDLNDCTLTNNNFDEIIAMINSVQGSRLAMLLYQRKIGENIKASLRSEAFKQTEVQSLAEDFGGGGHKYAAAFQIPGQLKETKRGWRIVRD